LKRDIYSHKDIESLGSWDLELGTSLLPRYGCWIIGNIHEVVSNWMNWGHFWTEPGNHFHPVLWISWDGLPWSNPMNHNSTWVWSYVLEEVNWSFTEICGWRSGSCGSTLNSIMITVDTLW
jgi:hypothetical protein